jgi:hypothetical protein
MDRALLGVDGRAGVGGDGGSELNVGALENVVESVLEKGMTDVWSVVGA